MKACSSSSLARSSSFLHRFAASVVLLLAILPWLPTAQAEEKAFPEEGDFYLESGDYRVTISPKYRYNMDAISYKGEPLTAAKGFFGTTFSFQPDRFSGSGHTEDGKEELISVELLADGKPTAIEIGKTYSGEKIEILKTSRIHDIELSSRIALEPKGVRESRSIRTNEPVELQFCYFFMYPWNTEFDLWAGATESGEMISNTFDNAALEEFVLKKDVLWTAVYNSALNLGVVTSFPKVYPGSANRSTYWKRLGYHKYYFSPKLPPTIPGGFESETYEAAVSVFAPQDPKAWVEDAAQIAKAAF